jgi:hypothetical protein
MVENAVLVNTERHRAEKLCLKGKSKMVRK